MQPSKFKRSLAATVIFSSLVAAGPGYALPIGFGVNQGPVKYSEIRNEDFIIYHDERTPAEGRMAINSLIAAKPHLETWFDVQRTRRLPVVMSAISDNASFANFITDTIELQTMGQGTRDLYWHEYVHSTMYRHFDNWFGPAGSVIHLPWMPAWFIEGLAEALSVSVGSDMLAGIERYQALTGDWPSYDRLHSLYGKNSFALRGYATSGAFVSWMLRKGDAGKLPELLRNFYKYSMPWWWPWAAVPFNKFMPMDESLRKFAGAQGEALYETYKAEATAYWKNRIAAHPDLQIYGQTPGPKQFFANASSMYVQGNDIFLGVKHDGDFYNAAMTFDEQTGWATGWALREKMQPDLESWSRVITPELRASVVGVRSGTGPVTSKLLVERQGQSHPTSIDRGDAYIFGVWLRHSELIWHETAQEITSLCTMDLTDAKGQPACRAFQQPRSLEFLGARTEQSGDTVEIWFNVREQTLLGDRHEIGVYETATRTWRTFKVDLGGQPLSIAFAGRDTWMLTAGKSMRTLRQIDNAGRCIAEQRVGDLPLRAFGLQSGALVLALYSAEATVLRRLPRSSLQASACQQADEHHSPVLAAVRAQHSGLTPMDLQTAFNAADTWNTAPVTASIAAATTLGSAAPLDQETSSPPSPPLQTAKEAAWRGRPVLAFPWIGADDALGPQIGAVSVPLMDHMQNETIRFTALYGMYSRFPNTELSLVSNRFTPTLSLTGFRQQTYNGEFLRRADNSTVSSYLDEQGVRAELSQALSWNRSSLFIDAGWKYAKLMPYLGPTNVRQGNLSEPYLTLTHRRRATSVTWTNSISGRVAPPKLNRDFDYNVLGAATTLQYPVPVLASRLDLGLEGSRTRGPQRRELQELYRPLKTFIAGTGGGYNQNSLLLYGEGGLFSARFSNTQGRAKINWTLPVIADVDKLLWIFYIDRLDFTAFVNYGGAWRGDGGTLPKADQLIAAHGYNLDLSLDNKGVRFNAGLGSGQVFQKPWQIYSTFGFDALF